MRAARMFVPPSAFKFMISPAFHTDFYKVFNFVFLCFCIHAFLYFCNSVLLFIYMFVPASTFKNMIFPEIHNEPLQNSKDIESDTL